MSYQEDQIGFSFLIKLIFFGNFFFFKDERPSVGKTCGMYVALIFFPEERDPSKILENKCPGEGIKQGSFLAQTANNSFQDFYLRFTHSYNARCHGPELPLGQSVQKMDVLETLPVLPDQGLELPYRSHDIMGNG